MKLKNTLALLGLILSLGLSAQTIMPLDTKSPDVQSGAYLKDLNGVFNKYLGKWVATHNGVKIEFEIYKKEKYATTDPIKDVPVFADEIRIHFRYYQNGVLLQERLNAVRATNENRNRILRCMVSEVDCGVGGGWMHLKSTSATTLDCKFDPQAEFVMREKCPQVDNIKVYLPSNNITFTKQ